MPRIPFDPVPYTQQILTDYQEGIPISVIRSRYGIPRAAINRVLSNHGLEIRSSWSYLSLGYDTTYFDRIDTHEKAYWLGFIYADGNLHENLMSILIKDAGHLEKLKIAIRGGQAITRSKQGHYRYGIKDDRLRDQLLRLGVYPRKSLTLPFPSLDQVPAAYVNSFILGYFDGDGCISISRASGHLHWEFSIIASLVFCVTCREILIRECDLSLTQLKPHHSCSLVSVVWGGTARDRLSRLYAYLYRDINPDIPLKRKRDRFLTLMVECPVRKASDSP